MALRGLNPTRKPTKVWTNDVRKAYAQSPRFRITDADGAVVEPERLEDWLASLHPSPLAARCRTLAEREGLEWDSRQPFRISGTYAWVALDKDAYNNAPKSAPWVVFKRSTYSNLSLGAYRSLDEALAKLITSNIKETS